MTLLAGLPSATTENQGSDSLARLLIEAGFALPDEVVERLRQYRDLLHERSARTNLTAVRDLPGIERRLILESLRLVNPIRQLVPPGNAGPQRLLDLGTGAGIPGMVLAIACPDLDVTLLDATGKKVAFLQDVINTLKLESVAARQGRAEDLAHEPGWRNQFDLVTARAVASLPALLELGLPMLRTGGFLVLPKGTDIADELAAAQRAADVLGGQVVSSDALPDAGSTIDTRLVVARKVAATPGTYPRRAGLPARAPLGTTPLTRPDRLRERSG
jgi:16S rRNA (guanine527-N7)-methyltransferase